MGTATEDIARNSDLFDEKLWDADDAYLLSLGWGKWSEDEPLRLCPVAQWEKVPTGMKVFSISGDSRVVGRDYVDMDYRFGCLAFGIVPGDTRGGAPTAEEVEAFDKQRKIEFVNALAGAPMITVNGVSTDEAENRKLLMETAGLTEDDMNP